MLALEAINAETGDVMAREQAEAASKEQVLTSLGTATSRLREKLGESLASIQKFDVPLPRATTPSLDALHAYSLALYEGREVPRLEAIPHLKRALELDPTFAMAHAHNRNSSSADTRHRKDHANISARFWLVTMRRKSSCLPGKSALGSPQKCYRCSTRNYKRKHATIARLSIYHQNTMGNGYRTSHPR